MSRRDTAPLRHARSGATLGAALALVLICAGAARASEQPPAEATARPAVRKARTATRSATSQKPITSAEWHSGRGLSLKRNWGIDIVAIHPVSSGLMLRFDYRVLDPEKAAVLSDKRTRPYVIDEATRTALAVPSMEKIGELRQTTALETGRTYFMIFGNPGRLVKPGSKVTLVAGNLRVEGLVVN